MRFSSRGVDEVFTYPCTKADVRKAFGTELLDSASFGWRPDHAWSRSETPGEIAGRVLLTTSVSLRWREPYGPGARLYAYRVRKVEWSDYLHGQVREVMRTQLRPWVDEKLARPDVAWDRHEERLVELREGRLFVHARRAK